MSQVILLERVDNLGQLGDVVTVKPGYARNYLIPQKKALRATQDNLAFFEAQKDDIIRQNNEKKSDAEKEAAKLNALTVSIIRHASEGGQLYGSVNARDIADAVTEATGISISRGMVTINDAFKMIGLFDVTIALHPEVKKDVRVNVARTEDEAKIQLETGKALIAEEDVIEETPAPAAEETLEAEALQTEEEASVESTESTETSEEENKKDASE